MTNTGHAERAHALLGASKASQWINCPPSARLQESIPDKRSEFADEGTAAHELSELMLRCELSGNDGADVAEVGDFMTANPYANPEMMNYVGQYVDIVIERYMAAKARSADAIIQLEERLDFSDWVPNGYGTGDVVLIADGIMEIIDLKYGKGVPVSAVGNSQMKLYALGALSAYSYLYNIQEVHMTIVQPRLDSVSTDIISVKDLLNWAQMTVVPAAKQADAGEGEFKSGEHCRWCKVKGNCRARADENMRVLAYEFKDPKLLTLDEVSSILSIAEHLQTWAKDVQGFAFDQAKAGERIPGWKLVECRSNRAITDKDAAKDKLSAADLPTDSYLKPQELLGIGDLEKKVGKKELAKLIGDLIVKPQGKPALVVETDKRPGLNSLDNDFAGEEFG